MYADDTQILSSSYDENELVIELNSDIMLMSATGSWKINLKYTPRMMFIGTSYKLNNKNTEQTVVVNSIHISRTDTHIYIGVQIDER